MSPAELEVWLERLHSESFGWALSLSAGDAGRAEEVLQNAYLRIVSGRAVYGQRSSFRTWLFGVIRMVALEEQRRTRREEQRMVFLDENNATELVDEQAGRGGGETPEDVEGVRELGAAMEHLPERQREVLHLVFYQDLSIAEAAAVMEISVGSARTHYERGKARLRALLGDRPHD
jgi:RNA polymerase sigma-70 factor (ECF subfamily)